MKKVLNTDFQTFDSETGIVAYVIPLTIDLSIMFGMLWTLVGAKKEGDSA